MGFREKIRAVFLILISPVCFSPGPVSGLPDQVNGQRSHGGVLFMMDASGSMLRTMQGITRLLAARILLHEEISRLDKDIPVGLIGFGNGIPGCDSTRLYLTPQIGSRGRIASIAGRMVASGNTPLARSLRLIRKDLLPRHPGIRVVIITDGSESCGGDPGREADLLRQAGASVHIIGIGVSSDVADRLNHIARRGNGRFYRIGNQKELNSVVADLSDVRRRMRNSFLARKWGLDQQEKEIAPPGNPNGKRESLDRRTPLILHAPQIIGSSGRTMTVRYQFRLPEKGDYRINVHLFQQKPDDSGGGLLRGPVFNMFYGGSHYRVRGDNGVLQFEIPSFFSPFHPMFVQGELWKITGIPEAMGTSNILRVQ